MQILLRDWLQKDYEMNVYACVFIVYILWKNSTNEELFGERKGDGYSKEEYKTMIRILCILVFIVAEFIVLCIYKWRVVFAKEYCRSEDF